MLRQVILLNYKPRCVFSSHADKNDPGKKEKKANPLNNS